MKIIDWIINLKALVGAIEINWLININEWKNHSVGIPISRINFLIIYFDDEGTKFQSGVALSLDQ